MSRIKVDWIALSSAIVIIGVGIIFAVTSPPPKVELHEKDHLPLPSGETGRFKPIEFTVDRTEPGSFRSMAVWKDTHTGCQYMVMRSAGPDHQMAMTPLLHADGRPNGCKEIR